MNTFLHRFGYPVLTAAEVVGVVHYGLLGWATGVVLHGALGLACVACWARWRRSLRRRA